ncbi:hypothetical protein ACFQVC_10620 [Streptomyces monticola]|uniref:Uncharacterized protein n=1 Tax=Streptomyces monticola TaxID=2666263 RepID=A0ABW2JGM3_9ACTN
MDMRDMRFPGLRDIRSGAGRRAVAACAVAGAALSLLAVAVPQAAADPQAKLFTGGGRGPTAAVAIQSAVEDAETSASAEQLYTCVLVGEPQVFETLDDPNFGHVFRAEATVGCTP